MSDEPEITRLADEDEREFLDAFMSKAWDDAASGEKTEIDVRLDWLLEKLAKRRAQVAENNAVAEARILQVEDWRQGENAKIERAISWIEYQIREMLPPDGETFEKTYGQKSRALPFGKVGFRQSPPKVEVFDKDKALAWAKARGVSTKLIPAREEVDKSALKEALKTHTDPDGFELILGLDQFYVKVDAPLNERKGR